MKDREGEKEWREGMEGGRERLSHYNTDFPHTHTYFEFDYNHCPHVPSEGNG